MKPLNHSAITLLEQISSVVNQLDDATYGKSLEVLNQASIGQHVRHTLEFFLCLIEGITVGKLNYDQRNHDQFIQEEVNLAQSVIQSIIGFLEKGFEDRDMLLEANYDLSDDSIVQISTSLHRELAYNIEHAIHHMALIKVGLRSNFPDVIIPDYFGVATSTIRYQSAQKSN